MMIRILQQRHNRSWPVLSLVDILRPIAITNTPDVLHHFWRVSDLDVDMFDNFKYEDEALMSMFPELGLSRSSEFAIVSGTRLLERSALLVSEIDCLFLRIVDPNVPVVVPPHYLTFRGNSKILATNVDLEIRSCHGPYEVLTENPGIISLLEELFDVTERIE